MKANKYAKLLSDITAANSTVKFHDLQITEFVKQSNNRFTEINNKHEQFELSCNEFGTDPASLQKNQIEQLHALQRELENCKKCLHKEIEKPALQYLKDLEKIHKDIVERILHSVNSCTQPCAFDLNLIKSTAQTTLTLIANCKSKIDLCLKDYLRIIKNLTNLELKLQNLDLLQNIEQTTKQVQKITDDLARLSHQVQLAPVTKERFKREFLPLSTALTSLQLQSKILEQEPANAPAQALKPSI